MNPLDVLMRGEIAVVCGGSGGIGRAIARLLANEGADVCITYHRHRDNAEALAAELARGPGRVVCVGADLSREEDVVALFHAVDERLGRVTALVNASGVLGGERRIDEIDAPGLAQLWATNVTSYMLCAREAVRRMSTRLGGDGGAIVNVSSMAGLRGGSPQRVAYGASEGRDQRVHARAWQGARAGRRARQCRAARLSRHRIPRRVRREGAARAGRADRADEAPRPSGGGGRGRAVAAVAQGLVRHVDAAQRGGRCLNPNEEGGEMPFVNIRILKGHSQERKDEIARRVSTAISEVAGLPKDVIWVVFEDVATDNWFVGRHERHRDPEEAIGDHHVGRDPRRRAFATSSAARSSSRRSPAIASSPRARCGIRASATCCSATCPATTCASGRRRTASPPSASRRTRATASRGIAQGRLVACEHATSRLTRTEPDGRITVLASHYEGKELNSPNDVIVRSDGAIYFSDPTYGRAEFYGTPRACELSFRACIACDPRSGALTLLADDFAQPNGLCFSADETQLFVNDTERQHIRVFDVRADGTIANGRDWAQTIGEGDGRARRHEARRAFEPLLLRARRHPRVRAGCHVPRRDPGCRSTRRTSPGATPTCAASTSPHRPPCIGSARPYPAARR